MGDPKQGLYRKFGQIIRTDGQSEPGEKHANCRYFVLDIDHDVHAKAAIKAYAESCKEEYPLLAKDLFEWLEGKPWPL